MKKHPLDVVSLVFGLIFLLIAAGWVADHSLRIDLPPAGWIVAVGLIVVGLLGIVSVVRGAGGPKEPAALEEDQDSRPE
ncbi:hypothetical protein [Hamadaea tsunoensis]|uniref:hypothetical protein n=1 Tax=Hamadaea tsunoensis TaxID=53368 RepID=UPI000428F0F5|nr:hypothetical protein [Hamadaea tsunoensis]